MAITNTNVVRLYPNTEMRRVLDENCDYRRFVWNKGLETWNVMYQAYKASGDKVLSPSHYKVRNALVAAKEDWQYALSARVLQQAVADLAKAWQNFFDKAQPDWGKPQFKSKRAKRQGFKTDRAKIVDGKLRLDRPRKTQHEWSDIKIKGLRTIDGDLCLASIYREGNRYYAALTFKTSCQAKSASNLETAVDCNVGHFDYSDGRVSILSPRLKRHYAKIKHYQRQLSRKAKTSHNYAKTRTKLQREYAKVSAIQHDLVQKFTTHLVTTYGKVVIEDLDVKRMQMSHVASKGLHRSLFGYFRQVLTYKCDWYGNELIVADRFYPSTQRCSACGFVKTGDDKITLTGNAKHGTKHNEYICYECGYCDDRDRNAVKNLLALT